MLMRGPALPAFFLWNMREAPMALYQAAQASAA